MVLEQIFRIELCHGKKRNAFILGAAYTFIGLLFAVVLFPSQPTLIAIAFTSLILLPSLNRILVMEENREAREKKLNILELIEEHQELFSLYFFLFLGILTVFLVFTLVFPNAAYHTVFEEELKLLVPTGNSFLSIFYANVLLLCMVFLASFIYGSGSIFLLTWHAALWGTIIGIIIRNSALVGPSHPLNYIIVAIFAILFHYFAESAGHFMGALAGGVISTGVLREKLSGSRFRMILWDSLVIFIAALFLLMIGAFLQVTFAGSLAELLL